MTSIYKYRLNSILAEQDIEMPENAIILSAGLDANDDMCIWAMVNDSEMCKTKTFYVLGTGWELDDLLESLDEENDGDVELHFINTVRKDPYIWHIFVCDRK